MENEEFRTLKDVFDELKVVYTSLGNLFYELESMLKSV